MIIEVYSRLPGTIIIHFNSDNTIIQVYMTLKALCRTFCTFIAEVHENVVSLYLCDIHCRCTGETKIKIKHQFPIYMMTYELIKKFMTVKTDINLSAEFQNTEYYHTWVSLYSFNTWRLKQNYHNFTDGIFKCIFFSMKMSSLVKILQKVILRVQLTISQQCFR